MSNFEKSPTEDEFLRTLKDNDKLARTYSPQKGSSPVRAKLPVELFAFRDRLNDAEKDHGSYHALDLYSIIAITTEAEWREAVSLRDECQQHPLVIEAGQIVAEHFAEPTRMGMIRLRESPYFRDQFQLRDFASALSELFPRR